MPSTANMARYRTFGRRLRRGRLLRDAFTRAVTAYASEQGLGTSEAALHVAGRLISWIAETFCDAVATAHLGPTYLYSFLAEVAAGTMDEPGEKHPPARERISLILDQLSAGGWGTAMATADPALDQWVRAEAASKPRHQQVDGFLVWAIKYVRAIVRRKARNAIGTALEPTDPGLNDAARLLAAGIPPAQQSSGDAIRPQVIILVCWFSALSTSGGGPAALPAAADAEQLATALPAALELSAVVDAWTQT